MFRVFVRDVFFQFIVGTVNREIFVGIVLLILKEIEILLVKFNAAVW